MRRPELKSQGGASLIEVMIALVIVSVLAVVVLDALTQSTRALALTDERVLAKNTAETQMEHVIQQNWASSYTLAPAPAGFSASASVQPINDGNIQKISITISRGGATIFTLEDYKIRE